MKHYDQNPQIYPDDALMAIVNKNSRECWETRKKDTRRTRFWSLLTWALYLGACLVLTWGAWIASKAALVTPTIGKVIIGLLVVMCLRCLYKLLMLWGDGRC